MRRNERRREPCSMARTISVMGDRPDLDDPARLLRPPAAARARRLLSHLCSGGATYHGSHGECHGSCFPGIGFPE